MSAWYRTFTSLAPNISLAPNAQGNYDFKTVNFAEINRAIAAVCNQSWLAINSTDEYRPRKILEKRLVDFFFGSFMFQFHVSLDITSIWLWNGR